MRPTPTRLRKEGAATATAGQTTTKTLFRECFRVPDDHVTLAEDLGQGGFVIFFSGFHQARRGAGLPDVAGEQ